MNPELAQLIEAAIAAVAPIVTAMVQKAIAGEDPLSALAAEHVANIIPAPLRLDLAMAAERAKLAAKK